MDTGGWPLCWPPPTWRPRQLLWPSARLSSELNLLAMGGGAWPLLSSWEPEMIKLVSNERSVIHCVMTRVRSGDQWVSVKMISRRTRSGDGGCEAANGRAQGSHWLTRRYNKIDRTKTERHDFWSRTERIKSRLHVTWLPRLKWCISSHGTDPWTLGSCRSGFENRSQFI